MKDFNGKILLVSLLAAGIMASSVWSPSDTMGKKRPRLLVRKEVLVEYVEDRLTQLQGKENLTEEEVVELNFIHQNRDDLQKLAMFYDMEIEEAEREKNHVEKEQSARGVPEGPPKNGLQSDSIISASQFHGEKAASDATFTRTSEPKRASVSFEFDRKIDEGRRPRQVRDKRTGEDAKQEKVTVLKEPSLPPITLEKSITAEKSRPSHLDHGDKLEGPSVSERGLPHPLTARKSSIEPEKEAAQLSPSSLNITEEEVKDFLVNYVEKYAQKDIDGFLSLLSSKCVQNRRYGFEEIGEIYSHLFDQSRELQCRLEDVDIEIYEEGGLVFDLYYFHVAEVKARYQVDQILKKWGIRRRHKVRRGDINLVLIRENEDLRVLSIADYHQKR